MMASSPWEVGLSSYRLIFGSATVNMAWLEKGPRVGTVVDKFTISMDVLLSFGMASKYVSKVSFC